MKKLALRFPMTDQGAAEAAGYGDSQERPKKGYVKVELTIEPVTSLADLRERSKNDPKYAALAIVAAENFESATPLHTIEDALDFLDEEASTQDVNDAIDYVSDERVKKETARMQRRALAEEGGL